MQRAAESGHPTEPSPNDYHYIYVYERASYAHEVSDRHAKRYAGPTDASQENPPNRKAAAPRPRATRYAPMLKKHSEKGRRRMFFHERFPTGLSQKWKFHLPTISLWKTFHGFPKRYPLDLQNFVKRFFSQRPSWKNRKLPFFPHYAFLRPFTLL